MVKLGIAGIGMIANEYISLIQAGMVEGTEITALCSRRREGMARIQAEYPALERVHCFTSYEEMLASGTVDGVLICTPHGLHPPMALQAVEAGLHVLVEKPVGIFCDEVERVQAALSAHPGLTCGVLYNRRASPAFRYAKEQMERGTIGDLVRATWIITNLYRPAAYYRTGSWRGGWDSEGGGLLMTQASHQLDLMQWLCGMPSQVWARCSTVDRPIRTENEAELCFTYPNSAHGHFIASAHECPGRNLLEICGTMGRLTVRDDREVELYRLEQDEREFSLSCGLPFQRPSGTGETRVFEGADNRAQQAATIQNFVDAIEGRALIQCSLAEGLRSLRIIHGAYLSQWTGQNVCLPVSESEFRTMLANHMKTREERQ